MLKPSSSSSIPSSPFVFLIHAIHSMWKIEKWKIFSSGGEIQKIYYGGPIGVSTRETPLQGEGCGSVRTLHCRQEEVLGWLGNSG